MKEIVRYFTRHRRHAKKTPFLLHVSGTRKIHCAIGLGADRSRLIADHVDRYALSTTFIDRLARCEALSNLHFFSTAIKPGADTLSTARKKRADRK
ncbi:hypothetical protein HZF05_03075 [Sphingomonas sp. CGMCC 1.13654]|uniref:Uncharacterized protein n=1 Tax=Sphingomonas chungangi TaxID=2683589 RepID=A0A838L0Q2_9SPHN|nr:hypothetical protein [Sphingomonas chungangi]MBA2933073.1 hypothetical protein [Sphingomonas chungangi]MVW56693.1 hypothetical protein [Sphingomonas chungangi]